MDSDGARSFRHRRPPASPALQGCARRTLTAASRVKLSAGDAAMGSGAGGAIACAGGSSGGASESAGGASGAAESQSDFVKYGYRAIVSASTGGGEIQSRAPSVEEGDRSRVKLN